MAGAWIENGPVALPRPGLVYAAAGLVGLLAVVGVGMGFSAAWRKVASPEAGVAGHRAADDSIAAQPIVDLAPPAAAPTAEAGDDQDKTDVDAAAQAAQDQALQAKSGKEGDIDQVMASPTEKPPAATKPAADEAPPSAPVKSDVPF